MSRRLTVFGPGHPFRGGIARTTTALVQALDDPNAVICVRVVDALKKFGPHAKAALPKLREIAAAGFGNDLPECAIRGLVVRQDTEFVIGMKIDQSGRRQSGPQQ